MHQNSFSNLLNLDDLQGKLNELTEKFMKSMPNGCKDTIAISTNPNGSFSFKDANVIIDNVSEIKFSVTHNVQEDSNKDTKGSEAKENSNKTNSNDNNNFLSNIISNGFDSMISLKSNAPFNYNPENGFSVINLSKLELNTKFTPASSLTHTTQEQCASCTNNK